MDRGSVFSGHVGAEYLAYNPHTNDVFLTGISYIANVFLEEFINILKLCLVN